MKKNIFKKILGTICSFAMVCASLAVNSACVIVIYEPEMPESANSLRKIN